jgi:hypothetical protein
VGALVAIQAGVAQILPKALQTWFNQKLEAPSQFAKWPDHYMPTLITGKTYRNEEVILDGYAYSNCEFYNVTFVYNGTTPIHFSNNKVFGPKIFKSDNDSVLGAWTMVAGFGALKSEVQLLDVPAETTIERPAESSTAL